jgi:hypothetical protein
MVTATDSREIMTKLAARKKYERYYIGFVATEQKMNDPDNELGYVAYIADTHDEIYSLPRFAEDGGYIAKWPGYAVGGTEIGGVYID